jgi:hypothetical protein
MEKRNNNIDLTKSTMQKRINNLKITKGEAQRGAYRKRLLLNQYRGFISKLLNENKITKKDIDDFFKK